MPDFLITIYYKEQKNIKIHISASICLLSVLKEYAHVVTGFYVIIVQ